MKKTIIFSIFCMFALSPSCGRVAYTIDTVTGAVSGINIEGDKSGMQWLLKTDKTQYSWVGPQYGWGLGYLSVDGIRHSWETPTGKEGGNVRYVVGDISIDVRREALPDGFSESYTFINKGRKEVLLSDIGIYTPFNDNYPKADICMRGRCHAHIWAGAEAAYVEAVRMRGVGDGVGLMVTEGAIDNYDISERGLKKGGSNFRGVIALCPRDTVLRRGKRMTIAWRVFHHHGRDDFFAKLIGYGGARVSSSRYVYEVGETATVQIETARGKLSRDVKVTSPGSIRVKMNYGGGKTTYAELLGVSSFTRLIERRVNFIIDRQQMNDSADARYGAYMVYDNETDRLYLNDGERHSDDTDEGRERVGMGVLLAKWQLLRPGEKVLRSLTLYARFLRYRLQDEDYNTFSQIGHKGRRRGYNYPWIADFYFHMYKITSEKRYAEWGYGTMKAFFRNFHYGFYAIDIPVTLSLETLRQAGMTAERDSLLHWYRLTGDTFVKNGLSFPGHEVNYEQSIVAPATQFLSELFLATLDTVYLDGARLMIPVLEAFTGRQPSHHLNGIAIRHWDCYWFGKRQLFGDTFPHYWSALNATAYHYFGLCVDTIRALADDQSGEREQPSVSWRRKAENTVLGNLSLFFEDGRASCAYLYPRMVDFREGQFYDVYANDQDWAAVFYLLLAKERFRP